LLLATNRNKTLTGIVGSLPISGALDADVQQLQFFLSEANWDIQQINEKRLALPLGNSMTLSHDKGVLIIDDSGDRKYGKHMPHVARQSRFYW
jgi:SRSO17 transposase